MWGGVIIGAMDNVTREDHLSPGSTIYRGVFLALRNGCTDAAPVQEAGATRWQSWDATGQTANQFLRLENAVDGNCTYLFTTILS